MNTHSNKLTKRDEAIKSMRKVVSLPSGSPERWRAAFVHFIHQRPEAEAEAAYIASEVARRRKDMDQFASSKHGRAVMSAPAFLIPVLQNTDPEYFINASAMELVKESHLRKLKKAFPEFFFAETI